MIWNYFIFCKDYDFFIFFLEIIILFNLIQFLNQTNFFFSLAYFFFFIIFSGFLLITVVCSLSAVFLWLIYFSTIIVFFIYGIYFTILPNKVLFIRQKVIIFLCLFSGFIKISTPYNMSYIYTNYINYYFLLNVNQTNELEIIGSNLWANYYSIYIFLIYLIFISCCFVSALFSVLKYYKYICNISQNISKGPSNFVSIYKYQKFPIQEYDTLYQTYTLNKHYKISNKFHYIRTGNRRV